MKIFIFFLVFHYIYSLHPVSVIMPVNIRYSAASREGEEVISFSLLTDMDQNDKVAKHKLQIYNKFRNGDFQYLNFQTILPLQ